MRSLSPDIERFKVILFSHKPSISVELGIRFAQGLWATKKKKRRKRKEGKEGKREEITKQDS